MNYWPHDAHMHLPISRKIACVVNASSVEEYQFLKEHKHSNMYISCGVHPWKADKTDYEVLLPYMKEADFLGEIGLDEPWCDVPFEVQKEVLIKQLQDVNKTTYLHTKGYEKEILQIITLFPRKYVVHWYSSEDYIEEYRGRDILDIVMEDSIIHSEDMSKFHAFRDEYRTGKSNVEVTVRMKHKITGEYSWCKWMLTNVYDDDKGSIKKVVGTINNVDEYMKAYETLKYRAEYDSMTAIYNMDKF